MRRGTRMLLMASGGRNGGQGGNQGGGNQGGGYGRNAYDEGGTQGYAWGGYDGGYGPDSRFRDRRGREHYDNGRFAPSNDGGLWAGDRYWDGREAYRAPESMGGGRSTPYAPPVYEWDSRRDGGGRPMNKIGFSMEGHMNRQAPEFDREYRTDAGRRGMEDETAWRQGDARMGRGSGESVPPLTRERVTEWVNHMQNADGTTGPHWSMEKTEEARTQRGIQCDPLEFYAAMNMMYSDYIKAAEKINCSSMDFYAYMAKAFLDDKDARPDKLARYLWYIVER